MVVFFKMVYNSVSYQEGHIELAIQENLSYPGKCIKKFQ